MIVGETGNRLYLNTKADVSAAENVVIYLKFGTTEKEISTGIVLGGIDITTPCGEVFAANQYFYYDLQSGDIDQHGTWKFWVEYDISTKHRIGEVAYQVVSQRG